MPTDPDRRNDRNDREESGDRDSVIGSGTKERANPIKLEDGNKLRHDDNDDE